GTHPAERTSKPVPRKAQPPHHARERRQPGIPDFRRPPAASDNDNDPSRKPNVLPQPNPQRSPPDGPAVSGSNLLPILGVVATRSSAVPDEVPVASEVATAAAASAPWAASFNKRLRAAKSLSLPR